MSNATRNVEKLRRYGVVPGLTAGDSAAADANKALIQSAIDTLSSAGVNGNIELPPGLIYSGKIERRASVGISGQGEQATTLIAKNGLNDNLLVDERWENNTTSAQPPVTLENLTLDGNRANNATGSCLVLQTYWSTIKNLTIQNAAEYGEIVSTTTKSGANIINGVADNRHDNVRYANNAKAGFWGRDVNNLLADQRFSGCDWDGNGGASFAQFLCDRFAGFVVDDCRFYSGFSAGDMDVAKFSISQIMNSHFENAGRSSPDAAAIVASVRVRSWSGVGFRFGVIANNIFWMQATNKTPTDVYCGVYFDQPSEGLSLVGNVFQAAPAIATKRAVHGATSMGGRCAPNTFMGYTAGTEYGSAWAGWTRASLPAVATDAATTLALSNALRAELIAQGFTN